MRLLINGRPAKGPGGYIIGTLAVLLVIAILLFVVLPILGIALLVAIGAGAGYLGMRTYRSILRGRSSPTSGESEYRIESSRQHSAPSDVDNGDRAQLP